MWVAEKKVVLEARENLQVRGEDFVQTKRVAELLVEGEYEEVHKERKEGGDKLSKLDLSKV